MVQEDPGLHDFVVTVGPSPEDGFTKLVVLLTTLSIFSLPHSLHLISTLSFEERNKNSCIFPQDMHLNSYMGIAVPPEYSNGVRLINKQKLRSQHEV